MVGVIRNERLVNINYRGEYSLVTDPRNSLYRRWCCKNISRENWRARGGGGGEGLVVPSKSDHRGGEGGWEPAATDYSGGLGFFKASIKIKLQQLWTV